MARIRIKPRRGTLSEFVKQQRTLHLLDVVDLANNTRSMLQLLDELLTGDRTTLELSRDSLNGLSSILRVMDTNMVGIVRGLDPEGSGPQWLFSA